MSAADFAKYLRSVLVYDEDTGMFSRIVKTGRNVRLGPVRGAHHSGYQFIRVRGQKYSAHRLAWIYVHGDWPSGQIDHVNGIRSDNRMSNLRTATVSENARNRKRYKNNKSGHTGVYWHKAVRKWGAGIQVNGTTRQLGWYESSEQAAAAYQSASTQLHGQFSALAGAQKK